ncbi:MAG: DUF2007 domain-containing protein [Desulfobacteraceae bacterium]|nr:MAG: DUF2007 domain-containing protein [Desulfobacteraceae bacterium]
MLKGILESYGIASEVRGETLYSARGELPITAETAPSVWIVDDSKLDEARTIVKDFENPHSNKFTDEEKWICEFCGEDSEGQFTECWNCGKPR